MTFQTRQIFPADHIKNFTSIEPQEVYLEGTVIEEPLNGRTFYGGKKANFTLNTDYLERDGTKNKVSGRVKVSLIGEPHSEFISYGDRILLKGKLAKPPDPGNPGGFDYAGYLKRNRIFTVFSAKARDLSILERGKGNPVVNLAYTARSNLRNLISKNIPEEAAIFLNAILLGLRQEINNDLSDSFMKTGTIHLIAISGLNVGLIAFIVLLILRIMRFPQKTAIAVTIVFLVFYAILTNGTPSVVRATVMSIVLLFGLFVERDASPWNLLGMAAIVILSYDPNALFDVGFQLSFISVTSILYLTPRIEKFLNYERKIAFRFMKKWKKYMLEGFFVSLAAWIGVLPIILYYFNIVTPISIIANLVAVPLSFLITASSIPFLVFGYAVPFAGKIFAASTTLLCETLFASNSFFSNIPFAYFYVPKPPIFLIGVYYLFLIAFAEHERLKLSPAKLIAAALAVLNIVIWSSALRFSDGGLKTTFLDVGHGDSVLVEFPHGGNMLIDGATSGNEDWDEGRNTVLPFLRQKGIQVLDAVVLTHPDIDHVGGLASILDGVKVRYVLDNGAVSDVRAYKRFIRTASKQGIRRFILRNGDSIEGLKDVSILCLNPSAEWAKDATVSVNDNSLVLRIAFGDSVMLFCGDIGQKAILKLTLDSPKLLKSDLLFLPHHGERLDMEGKVFVDCVEPRYGVISQGRAAKEISISFATEELLLAKGIRVFRTNDGGAVFAISDSKNFFVDNFRGDNQISR